MIYLEESKSDRIYRVMKSSYDIYSELTIQDPLSNWMKKENAEAVAFEYGAPQCEICGHIATRRVNVFGQSLRYDSPAFGSDHYLCDDCELSEDS
jgi:hypothetical protein